MKQYDFVVVGGGIAGASVAARLSEHAKVLVLEREYAAGYHSTGRSAALWTALYGNDAIRAVTRASRPFFDHPPEGFCEHPLLGERSVLYAGSAGEGDIVDAICLSPLATRISTREALERVPVLNAESAVHCAFERDAFDVDVNGLHLGFLRMAKSCGAEIVCDAGILSLDRRDGVWRVGSTVGEFAGRVVVNAAGAWADHVAGLAGVQGMGLQPLRRTAMIIDAPDAGSSRWPAVIAADESFYFKPDAGMVLISPADETPSDPCDAQPDELDIAICVDRVEARTKLRIKRIVRSWAGLRTFAPDRTPVVGYHPGHEGFFWLAGQGGYGVQTAPALSEVASSLALEKDLPQQLLEQGFAVADVLPHRLLPNVCQ